jgi:hypothetical protein
MKKIWITLMMIASSAMAEHIVGYPVYKFIDFGEISDRAWQQIKEYDSGGSLSTNNHVGTAVTEYKRMLNSGLKDHHGIRLIRVDGEEITVFIPQSTYEVLWKKSPHDLADEYKTHKLSIDTDVIRLDGKDYLRATNIVITMENRQPEIRK